jgi:hypothetical protein
MDEPNLLGLISCQLLVVEGGGVGASAGAVTKVVSGGSKSSDGLIKAPVSSV